NCRLKKPRSTYGNIPRHDGEGFLRFDVQRASVNGNWRGRRIQKSKRAYRRGGEHIAAPQVCVEPPAADKLQIICRCHSEGTTHIQLRVLPKQHARRIDEEKIGSRNV